MKFENIEVFNFEGAIRGLRNPKESWHISDSYSKDMIYLIETIDKPVKIITENGFNNNISINYIIGPKDMKLAQTLIKAGSEHRKFMRQIFVSVDITAPLYWWKEFDTYKVGTVANSTSTMHKITSKPITIDCFEIGDIDWFLTASDEYEYETDRYGVDNISDIVYDRIIPFLEFLRLKYLETKDERYWKELIRWLPSSWLQTRTCTMTYENLLAMCSKGQRRFHKLSEWRVDFIAFARTLPYAQELIFIDELEKEKTLLEKIDFSDFELLTKEEIDLFINKLNKIYNS